MPKRMSVTLSDEEWGRIEEISHRLKLTKASLVRLAVNAGLSAVEISQNPDWASIFEKKLSEVEVVRTHKK